MVAKLIINKGIDKKGFKQDRVLYTGTTRRYLCDVIKVFGRFEHKKISDFVYLDNSSANALAYAAERATFYNDLPVVLVVDTEKLEGELYYYGEYKVHALNIGSFLTYEFHLDKKGKYKIEDYYKIKAMGNEIVQLSEFELRQNISQYLRTL